MPGESDGDVPFFRRLVAEAAGPAGSVGPPGLASAVRVLPSEVGAAPPDWPTAIPVAQHLFSNWSGETVQPGVWVAVPATADQVVDIANWAAAQHWMVRALGRSHNWSPLMLGTAPADNTVLVDLSTLNEATFEAGPPARATFGTGCTIERATAFLERSGANKVTSAPGYTFLNFTAPGDLSLGGVLAVGGHGTGFPGGGDPPLDGTMSNLVVAFTAVVSEPSGRYGLRTFSREEDDAAAFLVHLGRALITEVTLAVVPNYYLQVRNAFPRTATLFSSSTERIPSGALDSQTFTELVEAYGRVEVIWFPFTDQPWVKVWERTEELEEPAVSGPYNYPWTNDISLLESVAIQAGLAACPSLTPYFLLGGGSLAQIKAPETLVMNGTARELLLYVKSTTARYSMNGYAVQLPLSQLQQAVSTYFEKLNGMIEASFKAGHYPVNGPVEIRVTSVDRVDSLGVDGAEPALLSVCAPAAGAEDYVVLWVDSLTFPGTEGSGAFYQQLEQWMLREWMPGAVVRPEWSKGWAYSASGPWTNTELMAQVRAAYPGFDRARQTLEAYDAAGLYQNGWLMELFS